MTKTSSNLSLPFYVEHWLGQSSLGASLWLYGYSLGACVHIAYFLGTNLLFMNDLLIITHIYIALFIALTGILATWQITGVWRSASNYTRLSNHSLSSRIVSLLAKTIGIALVVTTLFLATLPPVLLIKYNHHNEQLKAEIINQKFL